MKRLSLGIVCLAATCAVLALASCGRAREPGASDPAADEAAVRAVLNEIVRTFNAGEYDAMLALYEDDTRVFPPAAPEIAGTDAWRTALATSLPADLKLRMRFDTEELVVAGDIAYERGTYHVDAAPVGSETMSPMVSGRHIHIFRRQADGQWKGWRLFENGETAPAQPLTLSE